VGSQCSCTCTDLAIRCRRQPMSSLEPATSKPQFSHGLEKSSVVRFLYRADACGHHIPIPRPSRGGTFFAPTEMHVDVAHIAVACHECGRVTLYSPHNVLRLHSDSPCPYQVGRLVLVYIEAEGVHSDCEPHTTIRVLWDDATKRLVCGKPVSAWEIDPDVKCVHGRPLKSPLPDIQLYYLADMPF